MDNDLLKEAIDTIEGLAGQQAMSDPSYEPTLAKLRAAAGIPEPPPPEPKLGIDDVASLIIDDIVGLRSVRGGRRLQFQLSPRAVQETFSWVQPSSQYRVIVNVTVIEGAS